MERISEVGKEVESVLKRIAPKIKVPRKIVRKKIPRPEVVYVKAISIQDLDDVSTVKSELELGNIVICYLRPLADRDIGLVRRAVSELAMFASDIGGDIARLGQERIVATPSFARIWRERG